MDRMPFPTTDEFIRSAESKLNIRLPETLRHYLLTSNGGEIHVAGDDWEVHPVLDSSDRRRLARSACHIVEETLQARQWSRFPSEAVSIATNGSGDHLVLLPSVQDRLQLGEGVHIWHHDSGQLSSVADSFGQVAQLE
jgi:hypothetical protein